MYRTNGRIHPSTGAETTCCIHNVHKRINNNQITHWPQQYPSPLILRFYTIYTTSSGATFSRSTLQFPDEPWVRSVQNPRENLENLTAAHVTSSLSRLTFSTSFLELGIPCHTGPSPWIALSTSADYSPLCAHTLLCLVKPIFCPFHARIPCFIFSIPGAWLIEPRPDDRERVHLVFPVFPPLGSFDPFPG